MIKKLFNWIKKSTNPVPPIAESRNDRRYCQIMEEPRPRARNISLLAIAFLGPCKHVVDFSKAYTEYGGRAVPVQEFFEWIEENELKIVWEKSSEINWGVRFFFENENDLLLFKLRWS